jgi:hypothetical protein
VFQARIHGRDCRARRAKRKGRVSERTLREVLGKAAALLS